MSSLIPNSKVCKDCLKSYEATRKFFGSAPSGNLRNSCRACMKLATSTHAKLNPNAQSKRNAARAGRGGHLHFSLAEKQMMWERQRGVCACCGSKIDDVSKAEVDHAVPVAKNGTHDASNLFLAHPQCNAEKHNKTLDEHWAWRAKVGLSGERPKLGR